MNLFYISFKVAIVGSESKINIQYVILELLPLLALIIDLFLTLNTGIYRKGKVENHRSKIWSFYIGNQLATDLLSILPQAMIIFTGLSIDFILMARFFKLFQTINKLEVRLSLRERFKWFLIIKLVL
jgi:hypothetical protein